MVLPKISVIVPVYNVENYLDKCINSIINQSYENLEIILINDGSTDNSGTICDYYARKDNRIKVVHKTNGGLSDARNVGIDMATGEYISFIDSDDYIDVDFYKILMNMINKYEADISVCGILEVYPDDCDKIKTNKIKEENIRVFNNIEALKHLHHRDCIKHNVGNKLFKRELWINLRFPVGKIHEDAFVIHRVLYNSKRVVVTDRKLYFYVQRNASITKQLFSVKKMDVIEAHKEMMSFLSEKKLFEAEQIVRESLCEFIVVLYADALFSDIENKEEILKYFQREFNHNYRLLMLNDFFKENSFIPITKKIALSLFKVNPKLFSYIYVVLRRIRRIK